MARIKAFYEIHMNDLDLNRLYEGSFSFLSNVYQRYQGVTYEDVASYDYGYLFSQTGMFGGKGMSVDSYGALSGTVTGYLEMAYGSAIFAVDHFTYSAAAIYKAAQTVNELDDYIIFADILSGSDSFDLSSGNDIARGYGGNDDMRGRNGNDQLAGDAGNDLLAGGKGNDRLAGGSGKDAFLFDTTPDGRTNVDIISDFNPRDDTIRLENGVFTRLQRTGALSGAFLARNPEGAARDKNDFLVYETDTGKLFYDADGSGKGAAVLIATLKGAPLLTVGDFVVT